MMQTTSAAAGVPASAGAGTDALSPHASSPELTGIDARVSELHEALRTVLLSGRKVKHQDGDLDRGSLALLHFISERQPTRGQDLAVCSGLDASTVSRHTKALIDAGYATTVSDPDDARARLYSVTEAGAHLLADMRAKKIARTREALSDWSHEDIDTLTSLLRRLAAAIEHEDS